MRPCPFGSRQHLTMVGGLGSDGLLAPHLFEGAMNTERFLCYLNKRLIPTLTEQKPGAVVVLDNLKLHKAAEAKEKLEADGLRLLYLPPYSPNLAPIEQGWSSVKTVLRRRPQGGGELEPVEHPDRGEHVRRVGALFPAGFHQPAIAEVFQQAVEQELLRMAFGQARETRSARRSRSRGRSAPGRAPISSRSGPEPRRRPGGRRGSPRTASP